MEPLQFGRLWQETQDFIRERSELLLPVAAAFLFLPQLLLTRQLADRAPNELFRGDALALDILVLPLSFVVGLIGQLVVFQLVWHDGTAGRTLGALLKTAASRFLPALAVSLMQGIAVGFGLMLFVVPGLWLLARFVAALPLVATTEPDPVAAMRASWRLTDGHSIRILGMLAILIAGLLLVTIALSGLGAAIGVISTVAAGKPAQGWGLGRWAFELVATAASSAITLYYLCFVGRLGRALKARHAA